MLLGNTEAIEDLGIYAQVAMLKSTDAFKKYANGKTWDQLDYQTQQQIRLLSILEQANKNYGDAVNQNTNASQQRLIAILKNVRLSLGQAFLPIYQIILPALISMAQQLANVMNIAAQFSQALFGKDKSQDQTKSTAKQTAAINGLGDAYTQAGKDAKGALAGFDEINSITESSGSEQDIGNALDASKLGNGLMPINFETNAPEVSAKIKDMADQVRNGLQSIWDCINNNRAQIELALSVISGAIAGLIIYKSVLGIITLFEDLKKAVIALNAVMVANPWGIALVAIGALIGGLIYLWNTNDGFREACKTAWETIKTTVQNAIQVLIEKGNYLWQQVLVPLGAYIGNILIDVFNVFAKTINWLYTTILKPFGEVLLWITNTIIMPLISVVNDILVLAFKTLGKVIDSIWKNIFVPLADFISTVFVASISAISEIISYWWENILVPFVDFLVSIFQPVFQMIKDVLLNVLKPAIEDIMNVFTFLWKEVLYPIAEYIADAFIAAFNTCTESIGKAINNLKNIFVLIIDFIVGVFTGNWKKAWQDVSDIFGSIFSGLYALVKAPLNLIIDAINYVIRGLNKISIDVPDWVSKVTGISGSWGFNISTLPHLAKGAITNGPMTAVIGDNPGGHEVVSPLDDLLDMIGSTVGNAMLAVNQVNSQGTQDINLNLNIDGMTFIRATYKYNQRESNRIGNPMITEV